MLDAPDVVVGVEGAVMTVRLHRPEQHNAMTTAMYAAVVDAARRARTDPSIRVVLLRGEPGGAFASGTDISSFADFADGADGLAYERRVQAVLEELLDLPVPTVAVVEGYALGGGLLLAAACDLRLATHGARFGVPIARTLGNTVSDFAYRLLAGRLGGGRALRLLLTAEIVGPEDVGSFVLDPVEEHELEHQLGMLTARLAGLAPLTLWGAKRLERARLFGGVDVEEVVSRCYGSADFHAGVAAFLAHERPTWSGA